MPDEPYVLAVGQVTPRKGLDVLAAAAALLGDGCPPRARRRPRLVAFSRSAGEDRRTTIGTAACELLGAVDDATLASLYRGATLVCHPSRAEGFGLTCLEAMAAGAPLVATDLPSVREIG